MALLPEDRRSQGLLLGKPVARESRAVRRFAGSSAAACVDLRAERRSWSQAMLARLQIRPPRIDAARQARCRAATSRRSCWPSCWPREARILLLYDPTRGVDVGTKAEIFALMRDLAARGYAILFYSTDLAELANVADRTLVHELRADRGRS